MHRYIKFAGLLVAVLGLALAGCQNAIDPADEADQISNPNFSTALSAAAEQLTDIDIPIAEGSGFVAAGVGLRGDPPSVQPGEINIDVPGDVLQVLLYWEGHMSSPVGDDEVTVNGTPVTGTLLGGPTNFFQDAWSTAYRADITDLAVVNPGPNTVYIGGMDYDRLCPTCTNNGAGLLVIYDDGSGTAELAIKDGLDLAFFQFDPPLDTTAPVTFNLAAATETRTASLWMFASSVAPNRPNVVTVDVGGSVLRFVDPFQNLDGPDWDTAELTFDVPAGVTAITVQALSEKDASSTLTGLPASLAWLTAALEIAPVEERLAALGDFVWYDTNMDGIQDPGEPGVPGVTVNLYDCLDNLLGTMQTDANGLYLFDNLTPGDYYVEFILPSGYLFSPQDQGADDAIDSDADIVTGKTICTTLDAGETDRTWDAGIYEEPAEGEGCTPGYWKNHEEDWAATGYSLDDDFDTVFGTDLFEPDMTLFEAVWHGGGGVYRLGRHGTAALLSAAHPGVDYGLTVAEVIEAVQNGDADLLEYHNELGCPLGRGDDDDVDFTDSN